VSSPTRIVAIRFRPLTDLTLRRSAHVPRRITFAVTGADRSGRRPHVGRRRGHLSMSAAAEPLEILAEVFGYPHFQGDQAEIVERLVAGGDAVVLMPTGGGK